MSEHSESLHLRSPDAEDAVSLLRAARVPGVVMPAAGAWVAVFAPTAMDPFTGARPDLERLLAVSHDALFVRWSYADDHGLEVVVFERGREVAVLDTSWETRTVRRFDGDAFVRLGLLDTTQRRQIDDWLGRFEAGYLVAASLGLRHYPWVDAERAFAHFEREALPGAVLVRRDGTVERSAAPSPPESPLAPRPLDFAELANAMLVAWEAAELIALEGQPSDRLRNALSELLTSVPSALRIEQFLLDREEVAEVFGGAEELARCATRVLSATRGV